MRKQEDKKKHTTPKPHILSIRLYPFQMLGPRRNALAQRALVVWHDDEPFLERLLRCGTHGALVCGQVTAVERRWE